ncbi:MAG: hypothetical protein MJ252_02985 [archaeon]|nr:hypothetical protein [archaeon]
MKLINLKKQFLFLILTFSVLISFTNSENKWCWTKSMANEMSFTLDPKKGGMNWGFCQSNPQKNEINYHITLVTSAIPNSGSSRSKLMMTFFGDKGKSNEVEILEGVSLDDGSTSEMDVLAKEVGELKKIQLKLVGNDAYRCQSIEVAVDNSMYSFDCIKPLNPCVGFDTKKCVMTLIPQGDIIYEVSVKASDEPGSGVNLPVLFSIIGTEGKTTPGIVAYNGFKDGEMRTKEMLLDNVGEITGFEIALSEQGRFKFKFVQIKNVASGEIKEFDIGNTLINYPSQPSFTYDPNKGRKSKGKSKNESSQLFFSALEDEDENEENDDEEENQEESGKTAVSILDRIKNKLKDLTGGNQSGGSSNSSSRRTDSFNVNDPNGGVMDVKDKSRIITLTCEQTLKNPSADELIFGPDYVDGKGNYMNFLARCPADCHKAESSIEGLGLHPESSSICLSAMVDKAMSYYGGIISISIFPAVSQYPIISEKLTQFPNIDIISGSGSGTRSFTVAKVDNVDIIEKDIRILDYKGEISREGRVEMRINGIWGTICAINLDDSSAIRICRDLGYLNGQWMNIAADQKTENQNEEFCRNYRGMDYCGAEGMRAFFKSVTCTESDRSINTCSKEIANDAECPRSMDAIISCDNTNRKAEANIPLGVLKLEDVTLEMESVTGRLEISTNNKQKKFLPVCGTGANFESANIICKQMGYNTGSIIEDDDIRQNYILGDEDNTPFGAGEIECKGNEKKFNLCGIKYTNIDCKHSEDLIIKCTGNNGDYTGGSQYSRPSPPMPSLGKLGLQVRDIWCQTTFEEGMFKGDVGSVFLVKCRRRVYCINQDNRQVIGTGVYRGDSSICKAAIHAGIIDTDSPTIIGVTRVYPVNKFFASTKNGVSSLDSNVGINSAFSLFKYNSGWKGLKRIIDQRIGGSYLELGFNFNKYSFVEKSISSKNYPQHLFGWIETDRTHRFTKGEEGAFLLRNNQKNVYNSFTILLNIKLGNIKKRSFILSTNSCGGFNIYYEKEGLVLGDPCDSKNRLNTDLMLGYNDKTTIHILVTPSKTTVTLYPESYQNLIKKEFTNRSFRMDLKENIGIGRSTESTLENFEGNINYIFIYKDSVSLNSLRQLFEDLDNDSYGTEEASDDKMVTLDGRDCLGDCIFAPTPGSDGSPDAPMGAQASSSFEITNMEGNYEIAPCKGCVKSSEGVSEVKGIINNEGNNVNILVNKESDSDYSIPIECDTDIFDSRLSESLNKYKFVRVKCPYCLDSKALAFGTDIYHPQSSICIAALHKGIKSEYVKATLKNGYPIFNGSLGKNGIETLTMGKYESSFIVEEGIIPNTITCTETLESRIFDQSSVGDKFVLLCPKNCPIKKTIYGTDIYSSNSPICLSAIHSGKISKMEGGEIELIIVSNTNIFTGSKGISMISKSLSKEMRAYKFSENAQLGCNEQIPKLKGSVLDDWIHEVDRKGNECDNDAWTYAISFEEKMSANVLDGGKGEQIDVLKHNTQCKSNKVDDLSSMIILKKSSLTKGKYDVSFKLDKLEGSIGFIFGYKSPEQYYSVQVRPEKQGNNILLIEKNNVNFNYLNNASFKLKEGIWYRMEIEIDKSKVSVFLNPAQGGERRKRFDKELEDAVFGMIGLGVNGNGSISFKDIKTGVLGESVKNLLMESERPTFNSALAGISAKDFKKKCDPSLFKKFPGREYICSSPEMFCNNECSSKVNIIENIKYYQCTSLCRKKLRLDMERNKPSI